MFLRPASHHFDWWAVVFLVLLSFGFHGGPHGSPGPRILGRRLQRRHGVDPEAEIRLRHPEEGNAPGDRRAGAGPRRAPDLHLLQGPRAPGGRPRPGEDADDPDPRPDDDALLQPGA